MRKHYLDNIRWGTVLLVLVYHVFYMFNAAGVPGGVGSFSAVQFQDAVLYFVYPWFMLLLFLISGISSGYALQKMSGKEFGKARTVKLLVPSTLGLFVVQWIVGYYNIMIGGGLKYIPSFLIYPISAISGIGPLWFAQMLWLFSMLLLLICRIDRRKRLLAAGKKCGSAVLLLFAGLIWGSAQILNLPVLIMYRFGIYFTAYLLGCFVFSHDEVQEEVEKMHLPLLIAAVLMGVCWTAYYFGRNYTADSVLKSLFTNVYAWIAVLAVLGCGKAWFDRTNDFSQYMARSSYGIYVLHYLFVLIPCYYLKNSAQLPETLVYVLALLIVLIGSPLFYELLRRIPVVRWLVLGIGKEADGPSLQKQ